MQFDVQFDVCFDVQFGALFGAWKSFDGNAMRNLLRSALQQVMRSLVRHCMRIVMSNSLHNPRRAPAHPPCPNTAMDKTCPLATRHLSRHHFLFFFFTEWGFLWSGGCRATVEAHKANLDVCYMTKHGTQTAVCGTCA